MNPSKPSSCSANCSALMTGRSASTRGRRSSPPPTTSSRPTSTPATLCELFAGEVEADAEPDSEIFSGEFGALLLIESCPGRIAGRLRDRSSPCITFSDDLAQSLPAPEPLKLNPVPETVHRSKYLHSASPAARHGHRLASPRFPDLTLPKLKLVVLGDQRDIRSHAFSAQAESMPCR